MPKLSNYRTQSCRFLIPLIIITVEGFVSNMVIITSKGVLQHSFRHYREIATLNVR